MSYARRIMVIGRNLAVMVLMGMVGGCVTSRTLTESDAVRIARDYVVSRCAVKAAETEGAKVQDDENIYTVIFPNISAPQEWRQSYWLPPMVMVDKKTGRVLNEDKLEGMRTK